MSGHLRAGSATRRRFLMTVATATATTALGTIAVPAFSRSSQRPVITHGVQSGDVSTDSGMVWARADRPGRMLIEASTSDSFKDVCHASFVDALPETDFTAKALLENLPAGQDIFYRLRFQDLLSGQAISEPAVGQLRTTPADRRSISFVWSGDTAGQGWGIDPARGGMRTYATMLQNPLDNTFGPQLVYVTAPTKEQGQNLPPSEGMQFFGHVAIDGTTQQMTVSLKDVDDRALWTKTLDPKLD